MHCIYTCGYNQNLHFTSFYSFSFFFFVNIVLKRKVNSKTLLIALKQKKIFLRVTQLIYFLFIKFTYYCNKYSAQLNCPKGI